MGTPRGAEPPDKFPNEGPPTALPVGNPPKSPPCDGPPNTAVEWVALLLPKEVVDWVVGGKSEVEEEGEGEEEKRGWEEGEEEGKRGEEKRGWEEEEGGSAPNSD